MIEFDSLITHVTHGSLGRVVVAVSKSQACAS
ncbi:MAG: hypothetical protein RI894_157 [Bacteroidota bacterium]|jgi:hypothetical protein